MENITKALLIAGGVLFAILILTLLVIFHNQLSAYYTEQHDAKMVEQVTEFNNKFDNYNGQTIRGNELISVMNKVVDYNRTYSDMEGNERITLNIDLKGHQKDFRYTDDSKSLFNTSVITNASGNDNEINNISGLASELAASSNIDDTKLQKLSSNISIVCSNRSEDIETRNSKIKQILGYKKNKQLTDDEIKTIQNATLQYYQLTQFKRAMFKCTEMVHSQKNGIINKISFEVIIEGNTIKLN